MSRVGWSVAILLALFLVAPLAAAQEGDEPQVQDPTGDAAFPGTLMQPASTEAIRRQLDLVSAGFDANGEKLLVTMKVSALPDGQDACRRCLWVVSWEQAGERWDVYALRQTPAVSPGALPDAGALAEPRESFGFGKRVEGASMPVERVDAAGAQKDARAGAIVFSVPLSLLPEGPLNLTRTAAESFFQLEEDGSAAAWTLSDRAPDCDADPCSSFGRSFTTQEPATPSPTPKDSASANETGSGSPQSPPSNAQQPAPATPTPSATPPPEAAASAPVKRAQSAGEALPFWVGNVAGALVGALLLLIAYLVARLSRARASPRA